VIIADWKLRISDTRH